MPPTSQLTVRRPSGWPRPSCPRWPSTPSALLKVPPPLIKRPPPSDVPLGSLKLAQNSPGQARRHRSETGGGAFGAPPPPQGVVDEIEMSDVAADVAAFLAADTTDVLAADTTDVLSAAKAADGGFCPANNPCASG